MGRPPQSDAERKLRGNAGKRKAKSVKQTPFASPDIATTPAKAQPVVTIEPPAWLTAEVAVREWRRLVPELVRMRVMTVLDTQALAMYCQNLAIFVKCQEDIAERGPVYVTESKHGSMTRANPSMKLADQAERAMLRYGAQLGLAPKSRFLLLGNAASAGHQLDLPFAIGGGDKPRVSQPPSPVSNETPPEGRAAAAVAPALSEEESYFQHTKH